MTRQYGWTKDLLIHQIESKSYEKYMVNQTNFENTIPGKAGKNAILAVKDAYNFDFLDINEEHLERELEKAMIENIRKFLIEIGGDFCFIGSQYRVEIDNTEFFIDLLLYNRRLKSLVAIELKTGEFKPEYAGKIQFYLSVACPLIQ
jgi:predicted nuclease of restriction endonuclease-like (RecB) superfamily